MKFAIKSNTTTKAFPADVSALGELLDYCTSFLEANRINKKLTEEYRLLIEEVANKLIEKASPKAEITIETYHYFGHVYIRLGCPGEQARLYQENRLDFGGKLIDEYQDYLKQSYLSGTNYVTFASSASFLLRYNIGVLCISVVLALLIHSFMSAEQITALNDNLIYPINNFFASIMKTIAGPVVSLSTAVFIVKLRRQVDYDKRSMPLLLKYMATSLIAIAIGVLVGKLMSAIDFIRDLMIYRESPAINMFNSVREFVESLTVTNIFEPFIISNPLPLLIMSVLLGIAVSMVFGREGFFITEGLEALNGLFSKMLSIFYDTIPFFLFFALMANWLHAGRNGIFNLIWIFIYFAPLLVLMTVVYAVQLKLSGISPIAFVKEYKDVLLENLRIGSNIKALPYNKRMLSRRTKMPQDILQGDLALGSIANMDGNCLALSACAFYLVYGCGIPVSFTLILATTIIIILISVGAPNQPGSFLLGMIFITSFLGVSSQIYFIVIIIEALLGGLLSFINSVGDVVTVVGEAAHFRKNEEK